MASWAEFETGRPDLAAAGRALLYQFGVGPGFLATVRRDGIFVAERAGAGVPPPAVDHHLFRFSLERCLLTRTTGHGDHAPQHTTWQAPAG